jgi:hypothetical protein
MLVVTTFQSITFRQPQIHTLREKRMCLHAPMRAGPSDDDA